MTVVAAAVCDSMHEARPGRRLRSFQVALLILGSRLAPTTSKAKGGPGHGSEKRINLSKLCSEAYNRYCRNKQQPPPKLIIGTAEINNNPLPAPEEEEEEGQG